MATEEDRRHSLGASADHLYRTIRTGIRSAATVAIFYFAFRALEALGGQDTKLSIALTVVFHAFAELKFVLAVAGLSGVTIWAVAERKLRHRKVEYLQGRIKTLELQIDPGRTSSGLTPAGKTHPRDRIR
jgi:Flp pilus assembly protein protease CpaA